jgi:hypothetical protein
MLKNYIATQYQGDATEVGKLLDEFTVSLKGPSVPVVTKSKKTPSAYNLFIRDKILHYKALYPSSNGHALMRMATNAWNMETKKNISK